MLYIDVGNTLRGGLRTGIQRVVRLLAYELARGGGAKLIAFDTAAERYFALASAEMIRSADSLADIPAEQRILFAFDDFAPGDVFFEPDSSWTEPLNRGDLFRFLKKRGVIVAVLNHDVIPVILPEVCHPNTLISFSEAIADHLQYADYALTTSHGVDRDLRRTAERFLGRSMTTRVIKLGADFNTLAREPAMPERAAPAFPELAGLRYLLSVGTIEPRKNHALLLRAFDRLEADNAGLVIVGRKGWMSDSFLAAFEAHPDFCKRLFWYSAIDDDALLALYRDAYASVLPSHYEGYGLPAVEALSQGSPTIAADTGSLAEVTAGHAAMFAGNDAEALFTILDRLYREPAFHAELKELARTYRPTSWRDAGATVASAIEAIGTGASHDFGAPLRQMVYLSTQPDILDLSLRSVRDNLPFIDRVAILTKPTTKDAIQEVATRRFPSALILTDSEIAGTLPDDHQARNTWLRKQLYLHEAIEPNFLGSDEDYLALAPVGAAYFQRDGIHTGRYFLEDMGAWLAGSPVNSSYDRGVRNAWRTLREAAYPARGFASHMPQIVNKSLANELFARFVPSPTSPAYDEWSLYFNVAAQLYPKNFKIEPYSTLGWPMRMGDWLPQMTPEAPVFENYYRENYRQGGMFAGLKPLGDLDTKTARTFEALAKARMVERDGGGAHDPGIMALVLTPSALKFVASGTVVAGKANVRRILLINGAGTPDAVRGKLEMFLTEPRGAPVGGESVTLGEVTWLPLLPPDRPGLYPIRFFAALSTGAKLEARGLITVIEDKPTP